MSIILGQLCSVIIYQHFGENIKIIVNDLFSAYSKNLSMIIKSTKLSKFEVRHGLAVLLKFRLIKVEATSTESSAEYSLITEKILLILRYSRYVHLIQTKFGQDAALLTEELLRAGSHGALSIISKAYSNCENKETNKLSELKEQFIELVHANYFIRAPSVVSSDSNLNVPKLEIDSSNLFTVPNIDLQELLKMQEGKTIGDNEEDVFWLINFDRFHQDFRDSIMIAALTRQIDPNAGECLKYYLLQMYARTDPWKVSSNPIPFVEIKQICEKKSNNLELIKYLDHYISVIVEDSLKFLVKYGDMGGGQYVIQMKIAFEQLTWACIDNIITEKFGSKAARIFRVVRQQRYIEQEEIQKQAMVPSKEAKQLTYKLLEEHFLSIQTIRKTGGGGAGPAKAFYLFYVNQTQIVSMLLEICYKALFNAITRSTYDKSVNRPLIDKSQRLDSIVEAMKDRGESEEYISEILETLTPPERDILQKVKLRVKYLYNSEIGLDETIFLLQMYQYYNNLK